MLSLALTLRQLLVKSQNGCFSSHPGPGLGREAWEAEVAAGKTQANYWVWLSERAPSTEPREEKRTSTVMLQGYCAGNELLPASGAKGTMDDAFLAKLAADGFTRIEFSFDLRDLVERGKQLVSFCQDAGFCEVSSLVTSYDWYIWRFGWAVPEPGINVSLHQVAHRSGSWVLRARLECLPAGGTAILDLFTWAEDGIVFPCGE